MRPHPYVRAYMAGIVVPTLFLLGSYSPPFNRIIAEQLQAVLPHHKTALLEGQEHSAMASAPELFAQVLRMHLR